MRHFESGNIVFFILLAIVLVGLVTAALRSGGLETSGIDRENNIIKVSQIRQYSAELERAVTYIINNQISEADISFANPDVASDDYGTYGDNPQAEIFNPGGGGAVSRTPPAGVNDGSPWEFYASSTVPGVGSDKPDLIAVLPKVTETVCAEINRINRQAAPSDSGTCFYTGPAGRFVGTYSDTSPNEMDDDITNTANFTTIPANQACVLCGAERHYYHVLLAR